MFGRRRYRTLSGNTFGVGIVDEEGNILADERSIYKPPRGKGIIPADAARYHEMNKEKILEQALKSARLEMEDIDVIAYSAGPGLPPCLFVCANFIFDQAKKFHKPLIPVNHCVAHLEIGKLCTRAKDPVFVYLSGGNTQIIAYSAGRYRVFGETLDIPIGNCLDVVARELGLEMPGGPKIEKLAKKGKNYLELPYVVKGMDMSFSGILTATKKLVGSSHTKEDIAYSLQETCFAMLTEVTERALAHTGKEEVLLVGGVAANKRLQEMVNEMCKERGAKIYVVPLEYTGDNAIMVAWTGLLAHESGWEPDFRERIRPKWRVDEVEITWWKPKL